MRSMVRPSYLILLCWCCSVPGNVAAAAAGTDGAATPEKAVARYLEAWDARDRASLRGAVWGKTPAEEHAADIWADSAAAQGRVSNLIRIKFGAAGYQQFYGQAMQPKRSPTETARDRAEALKNAKVEVAGDAARVTLPAMPGQRKPMTYWLARREGQWRVRIASVLQARDADLIDQFIQNNWHYGRVYNRLADAIESGALKTGEAASQALGIFEDEELKKAGPASRPAVIQQEQIEQENRKMIDREARRARLEREALAQPLDDKRP
jgi:hypothetical protein